MLIIRRKSLTSCIYCIHLNFSQTKNERSDLGGKVVISFLRPEYEPEYRFAIMVFQHDQREQSMDQSINICSKKSCTSCTNKQGGQALGRLLDRQRERSEKELREQLQVRDSSVSKIKTRIQECVAGDEMALIETGSHQSWKSMVAVQQK